MKNLTILTLKVLIANSLIVLLFSFESFAKGPKGDENVRNFVSCLAKSLSEGKKTLLYKNILSIDWNQYLNREFLEKNNSGVDEFFKPVTIGISDQDIHFMRTCLENQKVKSWDKKNFKRVKLISKNKKVDYSKFSTYRYSWPLFNKDYSIAIIAEEYIAGMEDAWKGINIYRMVDGKWIKFAFVQIWTS